MVDVGSKLHVAKKIDESVIRSLFNGEFLAVRVPKFYSSEACETLSKKIVHDIDATLFAGIYQSNVEPFWAASRDKDKLNRYLDSESHLLERMRALSVPFLSPIDKLTELLSCAWSKNAAPMKMNNRNMPFGLTRLWPEGSEALPHQDFLQREVEDDHVSAIIKAQIGANIYLMCADEGGELELWDYSLSDEEYKLKEDEYPGSYGYPRVGLPNQSIVVKPQVGDLILVNTLYVHAVRKIARGKRVTVSGFVGQAKVTDELHYWS